MLTDPFSLPKFLPYICLLLVYSTSDESLDFGYARMLTSSSQLRQQLQRPSQLRRARLRLQVHVPRVRIPIPRFPDPPPQHLIPHSLLKIES